LGCTAASTNDDHVLVLEIHIVSPPSGMEDLALELVLPRNILWPYLGLDQGTYSTYKDLCSYYLLRKVYGVQTMLFDLLGAFILAEISSTNHQMLQCRLPDLLRFKPPAFPHIGIKLDLVHYLVVFADPLEVLCNLWAGRIEGCPIWVWMEGEGVKNGRSISCA